MYVFYSNQINGKNAQLSPDESRHCLKVLRHKQGDTLRLSDGAGKFYEARICQANPKACELEILQVLEQVPPPAHHIHIALAPTKNIDRTEWFVEKAVELGIQEISFMHCRYSERKQLKNERLERIALSATKQSLQAYLPKINPLQSFEEVLQNPSQTSAQQRFIAYLGEEGSPFLPEVVAARQSYLMLIGPEGGFAPEEIELARKHNFRTVSLGKNRYRTETAGIVACHLLNLPNYNAH